MRSSVPLVLGNKMRAEPGSDYHERGITPAFLGVSGSPHSPKVGWLRGFARAEIEQHETGPYLRLSRFYSGIWSCDDRCGTSEDFPSAGQAGSERGACDLIERSPHCANHPAGKQHVDGHWRRPLERARI